MAAATPERISLEEKDDSRTFSETSTLEEGRDGSEDHVKIPPSPGAGGAEMSVNDFWNYCKNEVPMHTKYGFFTLALLYALINNTVCRLRSISAFGTKCLMTVSLTDIRCLQTCRSWYHSTFEIWNHFDHRASNAFCPRDQGRQAPMDCHYHTGMPPASITISATNGAIDLWPHGNPISP